MKLLILQLIQSYALQYGIDPQVAIAVAQHESNFNPTVIGVTGDVGVFQLRPSSFPDYTLEQLKDPETNIQLGVQYLARMKRQCVHQRGLTYLVCYNYGLSNAKRVKHPDLFPYVKAIQLYVNTIQPTRYVRLPASDGI